MRNSERSKETTLKEICSQAVRKHLAALGTEAVLGLPVPLIKDLLSHLTICQLDKLQPALNQRGISTYSGWIGVLRDMSDPNHTIDLRTEEEAKREVMRTLFPLVFYGFSNQYIRRNIANLNTPSFLQAAAKYVQHFLLIPSSPRPLEALIAEQWPLLSLLEKHISSIGVTQSFNLSQRKTQIVLYVLHRLLDHGRARKLVVNVQCPIVLAWLLHGRGSQYVDLMLKNLIHSRKGGGISQVASGSADGAGLSPGLQTAASDDPDDEGTPSKRPKLDSVSPELEESGKASFTVDPQFLCRALTPCHGAGGDGAGSCPWGQIDCLEIRQCGSDALRVLNFALPTFFCLRSLTLHSTSTFRDSDVLDLAQALKKLSDSSRSSLTSLSISVLPNAKLMEVLLDAIPALMSVHVEIQTVMWGPPLQNHPRVAESDVADLPLEKLTVKIAELQTDLRFMTSVLRRCPHLISLHVAGLRLPTGSSQGQLLRTLSESNPCLRTLHLDDMKLSDCLPEIQNLLKDCKLEEVQFNDCRLLEKCSDKEESLQRLVAALKTVPSLHTLSLAQNRLAKNVCVLADLFSGSSPSSVKWLNISSNFIQPAELLRFTNRLRTHHPPHQLTLDLRRNPGDRDPDTWTAALKSLRPFCVLLVERWKSTDMLLDHVSNM
ncbi:uncharacterized protein lrrc41 isoform X2 [Mugil cephalus]|uniref:uncharacterized protein lrrc41 isoform X2 n=1 Tax=Mugil cephalus TaxID=48193 RepID=UPI001FB83C0A|nr:uncharacterized protein lrrc41 isoform X2 [Mugil cephalus]